MGNGVERGQRAVKRSSCGKGLQRALVHLVNDDVRDAVEIRISVEFPQEHARRAKQQRCLRRDATATGNMTIGMGWP